MEGFSVDFDERGAHLSGEREDVVYRGYGAWGRLGVGGRFMNRPYGVGEIPWVVGCGMRVYDLCVPPHPSAALTLVACDLPSQGEAFLFAFGRCWCRFRGLCPVWMRVRGGCIPGDHTKLLATSGATYRVGIDPVGRGIASAVCLCTTSSVSGADTGRLRPTIPRRSLFVCIRTLLVQIPWSVPRVDASARWLYSGRPRRVAPTGYDGNPWSLHRFLPKQAPSLGRVLKLQATSLGAPEETIPFAHTSPLPTNPVRNLTESLLLGMEKVSMPLEALTDEVVHSLFAHTSPLPLPRVDASARATNNFSASATPSLQNYWSHIVNHVPSQFVNHVTLDTSPSPTGWGECHGLMPTKVAYRDGDADFPVACALWDGECEGM